MARWQDVVDNAPAFGEAIQTLFDAGLHKTLATLRRDGSPRISGTEVTFAVGDVWLGSMPAAVKAADLERDGRCAIHAPITDETMAAGDAKIAGVAVVETDLDLLKRVWSHWGSEAGAVAFRIDITEVVRTQVDGDELVICSWHPSRGFEERRRK